MEGPGEPTPIPWTVGGYRLSVARELLDLAVFQRRTAQARAARADGDLAEASALLHGALALWRGDVLAGAHGHFVDRERGRLKQLRLATLEQRLELDLELGRDADLVAELAGLVTAHPLRESARELLMLALYRAGRQADALRLYGEVRRLLGDELGIDPGPRLCELYQRILGSAPELDRPERPAGVAGPTGSTRMRALVQLPADLPDFTGRRAEIEALTAVLCRADRPNIAGLAGLDGTGKTALAVHTAAGPVPGRPALRQGAASLDDFDIDLASRVVTMKLVGYTEVIRVLRDRFTPAASVVLFGGLAKDRPYPGSTIVTAFNGGIATLVTTLALELAPHRVNVIHPGVVGDTPRWRDAGHPHEARTPIGRLVTSDEIADAVEFLLRNTGINAQNLHVDGGITAT